MTMVFSGLQAGIASLSLAVTPSDSRGCKMGPRAAASDMTAAALDVLSEEVLSDPPQDPPKYSRISPAVAAFGSSGAS